MAAAIKLSERFELVISALAMLKKIITRNVVSLPSYAVLLLRFVRFTQGLTSAISTP